MTSLAAEIIIILAPSINLQPIPNQNLCVGGTPTVLFVSYINGNNSAIYQWYVNDLNSNTGGLPIIGANSNTYLPTSNVAGSNFYYCLITFQFGGCSTIVSNTAQVDIVNDPIINSQPLLSQTICQDLTINQPLSFSYSGGTGVNSILWYQAGTPNILINGVTGTTFQPVNFNTPGTYEYFAIVVTSGNGCDTLNTFQSEIIVQPTPYVNSLNDTIICNDQSLNINISSTLPSDIEWFANQNFNVSGELTTIQTSTNITDLITNNTTVPQFVNYTIIPTSFPYGCIGPDSTVVVQVQPDVILSIPTSIEICSGGSVNAQLSSNIPSDFSWFTTFDNPNVTGESITVNTGVLINDILINNSSTNQLVIYSVTPTSIDGDCIGLSQTITVMVKPPLELLNNDTITICSGSSLDLALVANTSVTFNWFALPSVNVLGESITTVTSQTITDVLINNTASTEEVFYNVIGTSTANGCSSPIFPIQVFVNPVPFLSDPNNQVLCNGEMSQVVNFISTVNNSLFTWSSTNSSIGIDAVGVGVVPSFSGINNTNTPITATITVSVNFENEGVMCTGNTQVFTITVNPTPSVIDPLDQELCNGTLTSQINFNGNIFGTVYTWVNDLPLIGIGTNGTGNIPSFIATNTSTVSEIANITVTPNYTNNGLTCIGQAESFTITILPSAIPTNVGNVICSNSNVNLLITPSLSSVITWQANNNVNVTGESLLPNSSVMITDFLVNAGSVSEIVNYQVSFVTTDFGCLSGPFNIPVTVQPLPDVQFVELNMPFCNLDPIQFQNNTPEANTYLWNFGDGNTSTLENPTNIYEFMGTYSVSLTAVNNLTGCIDSLILPLIIQESPIVNFDVSTNQGCVLLDVVFTDLVNAPNTLLTWDFGDGETSNQFSAVDHQYIDVGCFDVSLTVENLAGCSTSLMQSDFVCAFAQPNAYFYASPDSVNVEDTQIEFTNESTDAYTYVWDFGDGLGSVATDPIHEYAPIPGMYNVTMYAYSQVGCYDSMMVTITVHEDIALYVPNTFTPNDDEYNQYFLPILTDGYKKDTYHLTIFNRWGEIVFESYNDLYGWDGRYGDRSERCQTGTYVWTISVEELRSAESKLYYGHVNLLK